MKSEFCRVARKAFTLAEVLITLAIIGVVAAITIPSVIVNTNQMEFKTGLRKAVSVLNQAITLNKALTGESPYDNEDLYSYLQQYMSVMKGNQYIFKDNTGTTNWIFYTTDGIRFEFPQDPYTSSYRYTLYENRNISILQSAKVTSVGSGSAAKYLRMCGSYGLTHNPEGTTAPPCLIIVDVNGDRKPSPNKQPSSISYKDGTTFYYYDVKLGEIYKYADPNGRLLTDIFPIMVTDNAAIPYGVVAQKAMYQAQK